MQSVIAVIQKVKPMHALIVMLVFSMLLTFAAFYLEYVEGAVPCRMCWWQRYTHWALWGVSLLGLLLTRYVNPRMVLKFLFLIVIMSLSIGLYQGLGQAGVLTLPEFCGGSTNSLADADALLQLLTTAVDKSPNCADVGYTIFKLSLAWWNVIIMSLTALIMLLWFHAQKVSQKKMHWDV